MYRDEYYENRGARLSYRRFEKAGAPTLLGLHGFNDTARTFHFIEPMLERHFDLFFMDWRGHGKSSPLQEGYYNASVLFGDLSTFTGDLLPDSYFLMGHSMGAAVAARFAGIFPDEIRGLILFEGFSGVVPVQNEIDRLRTWAQGLRKKRPARERVMKNIRIVRESLGMMHPRMNPGQIEFFADAWTRPAPGEADGLLWHMDPGLRENFSPLPFPWYLSRALWNQIRCPVLLFFGKETPLRPGISPEKAYTKDEAKEGQAGEERMEGDEALREIMSHFQDIELHDLEGCGHNMHHDRPDEVARIIEDWLGRKALL